MLHQLQLLYGLTLSAGAAWATWHWAREACRLALLNRSLIPRSWERWTPLRGRWLRRLIVVPFVLVMLPVTFVVAVLLGLFATLPIAFALRVFG